MYRYIKNSESFDEGSAFSADPKIRSQVARTTDDPELIDIYMHDPSEKVRHYLIQNPHLSDDKLRKLVFDNLLDEAEFAVNRQNISGKFLEELLFTVEDVHQNDPNFQQFDDWYTDVLFDIGSNPNITQKIIDFYLSREDLVEALGANEALSDDLYRYLFSIHSSDISWQLSKNPNVPTDILLQLAGESDSENLIELVWNPSITPEILVRLYNNPKLGRLGKASSWIKKAIVDKYRESTGQDISEVETQ